MQEVERYVRESYLRLHFRLLGHRRHERLVLERMLGQPFLILPGVMNPTIFATGEFLAEFLSNQNLSGEPKVLDLGTGCGILAIAAAQKTRNVVAVDINPEAVRCARINVILNGLEERVKVLAGDLFDPVRGERFDLVVFNPPYLMGEPATPFEQSLFSRDIAERFASRLDQQLSAEGSALLLLSERGTPQRFLRELVGNGFSHTVVEERKALAERLRIHRVVRNYGRVEGKERSY